MTALLVHKNKYIELIFKNMWEMIFCTIGRGEISFFKCCIILFFSHTLRKYFVIMQWTVKLITAKRWAFK